MASVAYLASAVFTPVNAQTQITQRIAENSESAATSGTTELTPFKQARFAGRAILVHLPTNVARALVMPEPVTLKGDSEQLPGVELAFEGEVIGFFATQSFTRRPVSFVGSVSGIEYRFRIRASENGMVEPLEIIR